MVGSQESRNTVVVASWMPPLSVLENSVNVTFSLGEGNKTKLRSPRAPPFLGVFAPALCARFRGQFVLFIREEERFFCMVYQPLSKYHSPHTRLGMTCVLSLLAADGVHLEAHRPHFLGGLSSNFRALQSVFVSSFGGRERTCRLIVFLLWSIAALSTATIGFYFVTDCFPSPTLTAAIKHLHFTVLPTLFCRFFFRSQKHRRNISEPRLSRRLRRLMFDSLQRGFVVLGRTKP